MKIIKLLAVFLTLTLVVVSCKEKEITKEDFNFTLSPAENVTDCEVSFEAKLSYSVDATVYKVMFLCKEKNAGENAESISGLGEQSGDEHKVRIVGLEPSKEYEFYAYTYVRELEHNIQTQKLTFKTLERVDVTTLQPADVTSGSALLKGRFADKFLPRVEETGFYYRDTRKASNKWIKATGEGVSNSFQVNITGLAAGVKYDVYAYVRASGNSEPTKAEELSFTTSGE